MDPVKVKANLVLLLQELGKVRAAIPCSCAGKCKCPCEEMDQRAIVSAMLDGGEAHKNLSGAFGQEGPN